MAVGINWQTSVAVIFALSLSNLGSPTIAAGGWTHFIEQQTDVNNPNSHGAGALLSASQQHELSSLDEDVSALEDQVSQSINAGQLTPEKASELRDLLGKIESRQTDILSRGMLTYEDAESILIDEQRVKATLKSSVTGKPKPTEADYYDSKDAFEFRDHLIRKLYNDRANGALSANEYDELRSHVEHAGQRLDKQGKSGAHDAKLLKRMRALEVEINTLVGNAAPSPSRPRLNHYEDGTPPQTAAPYIDPATLPGQAPAQLNAPLPSAGTQSNLSQPSQ